MAQRSSDLGRRCRPEGRVSRKANTTVLSKNSSVPSKIWIHRRRHFTTFHSVEDELQNAGCVCHGCGYSHRQNYGKKSVSIYRCRLSMIEKLRTFFFHNYCFHNFFFSIILSVTVCPSIRNLNAFYGGVLNYRKYAPPKLIVRTYICGMFPFAKPPIGLILHTCICIHISITPKKNGFELWIHDMSNRWSPKH